MICKPIEISLPNRYNTFTQKIRVIPYENSSRHKTRC